MDFYRHLLRVYPRSVRKEYGDAMRQAHQDLRVHSGLRGPRLFVATTRDLIRSAPRLRLEEGMATHPGRTRAVVTILVAAALVGLVAMGPILGIPALICLILYMRSHREDVSAANRVRGFWLALPIVGAILLAVGTIAGLLMGEDSRWWPVAVGPAIIGLVMVVVSLVLITLREAGIRFFHRPQLIAPRVRAASGGLALGTLAVVLVAAGEDAGWFLFMTILLSLITLATLGVYALLAHFTRPRGAAAV